jgi:serine/threonine protein kinase
MGVVYKAEDTNLRRHVALKFMHPKAAMQPDVRERFRREAQASAVIDHPNVCHVYEFQENGDLMYIVMNYVEGVTLTDQLNSCAMQPATAVDIAIQIAQGLKAAHQKGIIHRDLKPGNIMITTEGVVKITDFGLAHLADRSRLTAPGTVMGTFAYMSPEQAQAKTVDRRSDLWAVGVLLYEMIAGSLPFRDSKGKADLRAVVTLDPDLRPLERVSPELERITCKLLRKDPAMRYQHADDLVVDLRALRSQLPESAPSVASASVNAGSATTVRAAPAVPERRWQWVAVGITALAVVLIVVIYAIIR